MSKYSSFKGHHYETFIVWKRETWTRYGSRITKAGENRKSFDALRTRMFFRKNIFLL